MKADDVARTFQRRIRLLLGVSLAFFGGGAPFIYADDAQRPVVTLAYPTTGFPSTDKNDVPLTPPSPLPGDSGSPWAAQFDLMADAVHIQWKPIPGAIRYHIEVAADPVLLHRLWIGTLETTEALVPLHGFVPRGPVYVRFQAVNTQAEEVSSFVTSSLLGRQTDLPSGIRSVTVTTQPATVAPPTRAPAPHRGVQWRPPVFSQNLTLVSGRFGSQSYNNYLASHGLDWNGDSASASIQSGARLLFSTNDREGFSFNQGDINLSTYLNIGWKHVPAYFSYNGYLYRYLGGGGTRTINSFGGGYHPLPRLSVGAQFTPDPHYLTAWG
jgi:hypothetical protein